MSSQAKTILNNLLKPNFNTKNWGIFAYSLLAALTFWIFNALGNTFDTILTYPVKVVYPKDQWIAVEPIPQETTVKVSGTGWFLTRYMWNQPEPITISIDSANKKLTHNTSQFLGQVREFLPGLSVSGFVQEEINLPLEPLVRKEQVPVLALGAEAYIARGYSMSGSIEFLPPLITISGPESLVDQLPDTLYIKPQQSNITQDYAEKIKLPSLPSKLLSYQNNTLIISFNAVKYDSTASGDSIYLLQSQQ